MYKNYSIYKSYCLNDVQAYIKFSKYNYVYDKFKLMKHQNMPCNILGIYPDPSIYPIIVKPIINLFGMSRGIKVLHNDNEYETYLMSSPNPSSFWMPFYETNSTLNCEYKDTNIKKHYTIDIVMKEGKIFYSNTFECITSDEVGIFKKHIYIPEYIVKEKHIHFLEQYMKDYTGCLNIEIIHDIIIEIHLRLNGDNYIYKENPDILYMIESILHSTDSTMYPIKYNIIQSKLVKRKKEYFYLPFFIENNDTIEKEKQCIDTYIQNLIQTLKKYRIHIYYDTIYGTHQQHKKRYCVITLDLQ